MRTDGILTPTRVELGSRCHRRHVITDILEKGLYESAAAKFGNVVHTGTAEWWKSRDLTKVEAAVIAEGKKWEHILDEKHSLALAQTMVEQYTEKASLSGLFGEDLQIVTIEERLPVKVPFGEMTFQLDRLLARDNDRLILVDTKTASRIDQKWRGQWNRSMQMRLYKRLLELTYRMPVDIVIEGLEKKLPLKIEYVLCPDFSAGELDEAFWLAEGIAKKDKEILTLFLEKGEEYGIEAAVGRTEFNYQDCFSYNVPCPFLKLCEAPVEERRGLLGEYLDISADY